MNDASPTERPVLLELSGHELLVELPRLKARGAFPWRMVAVCNGRWRVFIHWPTPEQPTLPVRASQSGQGIDSTTRQQKTRHFTRGALREGDY